MTEFEKCRHTEAHQAHMDLNGECPNCGHAEGEPMSAKDFAAAHPELADVVEGEME